MLTFCSERPEMITEFGRRQALVGGIQSITMNQAGDQAIVKVPEASLRWSLAYLSAAKRSALSDLRLMTDNDYQRFKAGPWLTRDWQSGDP